MDFNLDNEPNAMDLILSETETEGALFIGNLKAAQDEELLQNNNIKVVIDVCDLDFKYSPGVLDFSKSFKIDDLDTFDFVPFFAECFSLIEEYRVRNRKNVLVHCAAGMSRSATIVIGHVMITKGLSYQDAHDFVKSKRSCIGPNSGFRKQLNNFMAQRLQASKTAVNVGHSEPVIKVTEIKD